MRRFGRIEPGSGGAVFTGQPGCLMPLRMASTSEKLSALVRKPGCVARWIASAESDALAIRDAREVSRPCDAVASGTSPRAESRVPGLACAEESAAALH